MIFRADPSRGRSRVHALRRRVLLLAVPLMLAAAVASATTYYVDASSPNCSNTGAGTLAQPYCTISAAVAARARGGNTILVRAGTYREMVTVPASGFADGAQFAIRGYDGPVVIDGTDDFAVTSKWTQYSGNVWFATTVSWSPKQVFADGVGLTPGSGSPAALAANSFVWVQGKGLYVNVGGGNPGAHGTQVGHRADGLYVSKKSFVTLANLTVSRTEDRGIYLTNSCDSDSILNCTVVNAFSYGIAVSGSTLITLIGNVSHHNANHGIALTAGTSGCLVDNNESYSNAVPGVRSANGIYMFGAPSNVLTRNRWHDNQDSGSHMQAGSNNIISVNNLSWNNGDHGFDHLDAAGDQHVGDVAYGNIRDGFSFEGNSAGANGGCSVSDCIAVNNGLTTNEFDLWVDQYSAPGFSSNDNVFWNSTSQSLVKYIATLYPTVAAYSAATGKDTRTIQADPRFVAPASGNFFPSPGSPAIDAANSGVANWPATDALGNARVDDPSTSNTGLGPVAYADRGALEYQTNGAPPVAALSASPSVGTAPVTVTLDASASYDPDGSVISYRFNFGDGTSVGPQAAATTTHAYAAGSFSATVTVTDNSGRTASASTTVISNRPPTAAMVVTPTSGSEPLAVVADASGSSDPDGTIASYRFDFGDGTIVGPQPGATASHTYNVGTWQSRVTVTDNYGATATLAQPVPVTAGAPNTPPVAALTITPASGTAPLAVTADASGSQDTDGNIASYKFDFGDGTIVGPQPGATASHTYAGGSWILRVTVTDNGGAIGTTSATLVVAFPNQAPDGIISSPAGNVTISANQSVTFAATGSDPDNNLPLSYAWDFGGGAPNRSVQNPGTVVFPNPGSYTVTFTVKDSLGLADPTPATRVVTVTAPDLNLAADEIHWTLTGQTSVTFDWRGPQNTIRYGLTPAYGQTAVASTPNPLPFSSAGPFWEARIGGLAENTIYHYAIGNSADHTFHTPLPRGSAGFTIMAEADIGDASVYPEVAGVQADIAAVHPAFTLCVGDLSYGNDNGQDVVDHHFNDVMAWSRDAAYMPAWGNHEWDKPTDDFRNYKGRFDLPNTRYSPNAPAPGAIGKDWYWFDYGNVRFIAYPEPYSGAWADWYPRAWAIMDSAQADTAIRFIVTFGHRPAYSSGHHPGDSQLRSFLDGLGANHNKYVLNLDGHSHNYERSYPQSGVVHVTFGTGGASLEEDPNGGCVWLGGCPAPAWSAFRAFHRGALRLRFSANGIVGEQICGPSVTTGNDPDDVSCTEGSILDTFTIGTFDGVPVASAPAQATTVEDSLMSLGVTVSDPDGDAITTLTADLSRLPAGNNAVFTAGPGNTSGTLTWKPTFADSGTYSVSFIAGNLLTDTVTTSIRVNNTDRGPVVVVPSLTVAGREDSVLTVGVTASDPDGDLIGSLTANLSQLPAGNNAVYTPGPGNTSGTLTWKPTFADSGTYAVTFTAANGMSGAATATVHVDNLDRAPVLTAPAVLAGGEGTPISYTVVAADPDSDAITSLTADLSALPAGNDAVFTAGPGNRSGTLTWSPTFNDSGPFPIPITARNAMATTATTIVSVGRTDRAPVVTRPAQVTAAENTAFSVNVSASDPDGDAITSLTADLSGLPGGNAASFSAGPGNTSGVLNWTPTYRDSGTYSVRWIAANALADTTTTLIHVVNTDRAPVVTVPASVVQPAATLITFTITAADPDSDAITSLSANLSTLPAGNTATFTASGNKRSGTFQWTPAAKDTGTYSIPFTAANALSGSATTSVRVSAANQPPVAVLGITPDNGFAPLATVASGTGSSDPEGGALTYRFDFGDGTVVGPQAAATASHTYATGNWTASLTVTDNFGATSTATAPVLVGTNLVGNPSFETNTSGWNSAFVGAAIQRVAGGYDGGFSLQMSAAAGSMVAFGLNDSPNWVVTTPAAGRRYHFSAWVRSSGSRGQAVLYIREYLNGIKVGTTLKTAGVALSPTWQQITGDYMNQSAGSTIDFQVMDYPVAINEVFQTDALSIQLVPNPTAPALMARAEVAATLEEPLRPVVAPSPVRSSSVLSFATARPGPLTVEIFDLAGRRVRHLVDDSSAPAGHHEFALDGRDDGGRRLYAGVYLYRVQAGGEVRQGRFVMLR